MTYTHHVAGCSTGKPPEGPSGPPGGISTCCRCCCCFGCCNVLLPALLLLPAAAPPAAAPDRALAVLMLCHSRMVFRHPACANIHMQQDTGSQYLPRVDMLFRQFTVSGAAARGVTCMLHPGRRHQARAMSTQPCLVYKCISTAPQSRQQVVCIEPTARHSMPTHNATPVAAQLHLGP